MNKCQDCGYTWRQSVLTFSIKCPNCGSTNYTYAKLSIGCLTFVIGAVVLISIIGYFMGRYNFDCAKEKTYKVTTNSLSVYEAPTIESDVYGFKQEGELVCEMDSTNGWIKIKEGWLSKRYLIKIDN